MSVATPGQFLGPGSWTGDTDEEVIAAGITALSESREGVEALVTLLPEDHAIYRDRSTGETMRLKGFILASIARIGLPEAGLPYVLDELQNSREAYLTAAAAIALRSWPKRRRTFAPILHSALRNVMYADDSMSFDSFRPIWPLKRSTTAVREVLLTVQWLGSAARSILPELEELSRDPYTPLAEDRLALLRNTIVAIQSDGADAGEACCGLPGDAPPSLDCRMDPGAISLEDQDGVTTTVQDALARGRTVVAFFYTRCTNPSKCSMTVTKLGLLQRELVRLGMEARVQIAAFTYDPLYDSGNRLREYGTARGFEFGQCSHFYRCPTGFAPLQQLFGVRVGFVGSIVNRHRIELLIVDPGLNLVASFTRLQWVPSDVIFALENASLPSTPGLESVSAPAAGVRQPGRSAAAAGGVVSAVVLALIPKCPMCWMAYASALGIAGVAPRHFETGYWPILFLTASLNLVFLYVAIRRRNGGLPFWLGLSGIAVVLSAAVCGLSTLVTWSGVGLVLAGAIANALPMNVPSAEHRVSSASLHASGPTAV